MSPESKHNTAVHGKIAEEYTKEYFTDMTDLPFLDRFADIVSPGGRLLDVACGPGMFTKYYLDKGFRAEGVDLAPEMIEIAKKKVPSAEFQVMNMYELKFEDGTFDGLLLAYALIFIPSKDTNKVLVELRRVLKPHGKILIICQLGEGDHKEIEPMMPNEQLFVNFFRPGRLREHLEKTGYSIVSQEVTRDPQPFGSSEGVIYTIAETTS